MPSSEALSVKELFDELAQGYDERIKRNGYFAPGWVTAHAGELEDRPEFRVLDLACGTGLNVRVLAGRRKGIRADGIDLSPKMLELARASALYERLYVRDLNYRLPDIPSESFDLVIAFGFLEWLDYVGPCISECHRLLKPNGILWATFRRFEAGDEASPRRQVEIAGGRLTGYSAAEIVHVLNQLDLHIVKLEETTGYLTSTGFPCPYYVLRAAKVSNCGAGGCAGSP